MSIDIDLAPDTQTTPIPTAGTPTECPRCGAPAISTRGVAAHTKWHAAEDRRVKRLTGLMDALEAMLATFTEPDADGQTITFREWVDGVDEHLHDHAEGLTRLAQLLAARPAATAVPWLAEVGEDADIPSMPETGDPVEGEPDEDGLTLPEDEIRDLASLLPDGSARYPVDQDQDEDDDPDAVDHPAATRRF